MRKRILIFLIVLSASSITIAEDYAGYAGAFLRNGIGARALGMGGAFTAVAEGIDAIYFNPAGLGFVPRTMVGISNKSLSMDRHFGHIAFAFPIRNEAAMAASWLNGGVSDVEMRGGSRQIIGDLGNGSNAFALSFGKALSSKFSFGGKIRYIQEEFDDFQSFTIGLDVGAIVRPHKYLSVGAVIQNFGSEHQWDGGNYWTRGTSYKEKFPIVMKFGLAGNLFENHLIPAIDIETSENSELKFRAGSEYWYTKKVTRRVEDEYEEDVFIDIVEDVRIAGLRIGIDRGSPTFGGSIIHEMRKIRFSLEYAFMVGRENTASGHLFTLGMVF